MTVPLDGDEGALAHINEHRRAEDAIRWPAELQTLLLEVASDLIRASEPGELGRMTFEHMKSALGAAVCTNYRFDPAAQRLRLVYVHGIRPEKLEAAKSLELGQEYCGTVAATCLPLVANKQRIASDPRGGLVRKLGATAYACHPLKASDGRLLGTFAVASATRESFTHEEVAWLGTITNFLAQAWERFEAEHCLRASEERLRLSQEAAGLGHWDYDYASGTLMWSDQTRKLLGVGPGEPASRALLRSRVHPEDRPRLEEHIARSTRLDSGPIRHFEFRVVMPNGVVRWLEDQDRVERNASGMPIRAVGVLRDITARKDAEEAQARLAAIVTSSADAIIGKTLDGIVTSWNEAAERVFGYSADEMIGQSIRRLIPADRQPEEDMILAHLARSECIKRYETVRTAKDGRTFDASITISPVRDAEGRVIGAAKIICDITERKRTEARLAEREGLLALFVEHAPAVIAMFDDKMRYLAVSRRYVSDFRLPADIELIGRSHYEIFPEIPPRWREVHARVLAGEELAHEEDPFLRLDGRTDWCRWLMKPWRTADGRIGGALLFSEVITAQLEARRALADSEARFRSSLLHSPLPVLLFDDREQILALSQSWLDQTGYSREELCRIEDWTARAYGARSGEVLEHIRQIISTEPAAERAELAIRTKSGCERVWSFVSSALGAQSDGRRLFVCVAQDVTEQKSHEEHVQLLMREINHRAKNMLSIVQAIARQTTARDPEDFVERFAERIQALAANQDLLIRNEWHGVDVEALVRAQLAHFADLVGSRIDVRGPKLRLNPAAAQAIGLTLHELATNAGKYGAISMNGGHVDVCWGIDDDTLTMSWIERDGPPVLPPERRGFGTTVIASMAKATVGGEVQLDYDPSGLVWRLSCPVANALEG